MTGADLLSLIPAPTATHGVGLGGVALNLGVAVDPRSRAYLVPAKVGGSPAWQWWRCEADG